MKTLHIFSQNGLEICDVTKGKFLVKAIEIDSTGLYVVQIQPNGENIYNCGVYFDKTTAKKEISRLYKNFKLEGIDGFQFVEEEDLLAIDIIDELWNAKILKTNADEQKAKLLRELIGVVEKYQIGGKKFDS